MKNKLGAVLLMILFLAAWVLMPKDFSLTDKKILPFFAVAAAAVASLLIEVRLPKKAWKAVTLLSAVVLPFLWLFMTEFMIGNNIFTKKPVMILLGYGIYLSFELLFLFVTGGMRWTAVLCTLMFMTHAVMNYFVTISRGYGIRTTDFTAFQTAVNVASEYNLFFQRKQAGILLLAVVLICFGLHCSYRLRPGGRAAAGLLFAAAAGGLFLVMNNEGLMEKYSIRPYMWFAKESCEDHGAALEFAAGIPYLKVKSPEGYSGEKADLIEKEAAQKKCSITSTAPGAPKAAGAPEAAVPQETSGQGEAVHPDIVVIMNESLSDLRNCGSFETDQEYLEYFYSLNENVIRGTLSVPVQGGITANTEFEFLTGFSTAFLPAGTVAFQNYIRGNTPNFGGFLKDNGYYTIFMHPYLKSGWNREYVYSSFGFDEVDWQEDFGEREMLRGYMSDKGDYEGVIEKYEEAAAKGGNVFLYNVTMQNHGGYLTEDYEKTVHLLNMEGDYPAAEEYLSLIRESDEALKGLVDYFSRSERPVLLCVFGDHTPAVEEAFYDEISAGTGDSVFMKEVKKHQTPFIICANYDIGETNYENISVNYLPVLLAETAGVEKDDWYSFLASVYQDFPVVNFYGVRDAEGAWHEWGEVSGSAPLTDYSFVQYRNLFDK